MLVLLLEVGTWQDGIVEHMRILSEIGKDCAIAIPRSWGEAVRAVEHGRYYTLALISNFIVGSIHFTHNSGETAVWFDTLQHVEERLNA